MDAILSPWHCSSLVALQFDLVMGTLLFAPEVAVTETVVIRRSDSREDTFKATCQPSFWRTYRTDYTRVVSEVIAYSMTVQNKEPKAKKLKVFSTASRAGTSPRPQKKVGETVKTEVKTEVKKEVKKEVTISPSVRGQDGKFPRPRGAARKGKKWDYDNGDWVTDDESDDSTPIVKSKGKWPRPRGAAPLSDSGKKQEWSYELGDWVEIEVKEVKRTREEVMQELVESTKHREWDDEDEDEDEPAPKRQADTAEI